MKQKKNILIHIIIKQLIHSKNVMKDVGLVMLGVISNIIIA